MSRISSKFNYSLVLIRHHAQQQHTCRIPGEGCWPYSLLRVGDERSHDAILCDGGGIPAWKCYGTLKSALSSVWCATRSAANGACNRNGCTRNCTFWAEMHSRTPKACTPLFYPVENLRPEMSWVGREFGGRLIRPCRKPNWKAWFSNGNNSGLRAYVSDTRTRNRYRKPVPENWYHFSDTGFSYHMKLWKQNFWINFSILYCPSNSC